MPPAGITWGAAVLSLFKPEEILILDFFLNVSFLRGKIFFKSLTDFFLIRTRFCLSQKSLIGSKGIGKKKSGFAVKILPVESRCASMKRLTNLDKLKRHLSVCRQHYSDVTALNESSD